MRRLLLALVLVLPGCAALAPRPATVEARLAALPSAVPVARPVTIRWNPNMIPWIEAERDEDLAFALGLVHGHLRGAQIALLRMISQGRLAEIAGPLATEIDHALRALGFGRAAPQVVAAWPEETRVFVERFLAGLNAATQRRDIVPPEFALLGLRPEPYTAEQLIAIGRLAGTDVNWLSWFALLPQRDRADFRANWARVLQAGSGAIPMEDPLAAILAGHSRAGSNTVAVHARRSATGGALLANDPHLGLNLPNLWLVVGMRSPSHHAVGAMVPGLPIIGFGRNPDLAWGGTNMRAASSDLFDVSALPPEAFHIEEARIAQRFWFPTTRRTRVTEHGPVITDAPVIPNGGPGGGTLALRWAGHLPTDEITALLRGARARSGAEFQAEFGHFAVSAQNMMWAERGGGIGRFMAATLPDRPGFRASGPVLDATNPAHTAPWQRLRDMRSLPTLTNPPEGVLASANENPASWTPSAPPVGYFFSDGDRVERLQALLASRRLIGVADIERLQRDTVAPRAARIAAGLLARYDALPGGAPAFLAPLRGWDGDYAPTSEAALIFELLLARIIPALRPEGAAAGPETGWNFITRFLLEDLDAVPAERRATILRDAARQAEPIAARHRTWGEAHRLRAAHWLVNLPLLGGRFVFGDFPSGGSRETPMKTSHGLIEGRHNVTFGSMARHISDMSDPDANWFVLWGGQDGWLGSASFADQVPLWREGRMIRLPLRPATVAAEFPIVTRLIPQP